MVVDFQGSHHSFQLMEYFIPLGFHPWKMNGFWTSKSPHWKRNIIFHPPPWLWIQPGKQTSCCWEKFPSPGNPQGSQPFHFCLTKKMLWIPIVFQVQLIWIFHLPPTTVRRAMWSSYQVRCTRRFRWPGRYLRVWGQRGVSVKDWVIIVDALEIRPSHQLMW